jgi:carbonic anhydrase
VAPQCAATVENQSPIDILTANPLATTNGLVFQGLPDSATTPEIRAQLVINDHTWEVNWDVDDAAETKYGVEYNQKVYRLQQFHFHSPSEHTVDGQHYDFEAHLVHACYGDISCTTEDPNDENLVVAILMNVGDENPYLQSFWPRLAALAADSNAPPFVEDLANPYTRLVPPAPHDFYRYIGSTTTPQCVQGVEWFLMTTPATLSQAQLTSYRTAITQHANTQTLTVAQAPTGASLGWDVALGTNNRPIQATLNRVPEKYTSPAEVAEQQSSFMWHSILIFVGLVTVAICCLLAFTTLTKPKDKKPAKRALKPKPTPKEEVPLVTPAPPPMLFTQPLQVPVTTFAQQTYAAPPQYGQSVVMQQPMFAQGGRVMVAP